MVWSFEGADACKHIYICECMYKYTLQKESLFFSIVTVNMRAIDLLNLN